MLLVLKSGNRTLKLESTLDGFEEIVDRRRRGQGEAACAGPIDDQQSAGNFGRLVADPSEEPSDMTGGASRGKSRSGGMGGA